MRRYKLCLSLSAADVENGYYLRMTEDKTFSVPGINTDRGYKLKKDSGAYFCSNNHSCLLRNVLRDPHGITLCHRLIAAPSLMFSGDGKTSYHHFALYLAPSELLSLSPNRHICGRKLVSLLIAQISRLICPSLRHGFSYQAGPRCAHALHKTRS